MGQRQLEPEEHGGGQRGELEWALAARDHRDDAGEREHGELEDQLHGRRSGIPRAWYWPQSQGENGESRSSW